MHMGRPAWVRVMAAATLAVSLVMAGCGCSQSYYKSHEISRAADNFEVTRRITVFNVRTNEVMWQLTGNFSVRQSAGDIDVVVSRGNGVFQKFFFQLNEWTTYLVEDLDNSDWPAYDFEMEIKADKDGNQEG